LDAERRWRRSIFSKVCKGASGKKEEKVRDPLGGKKKRGTSSTTVVSLKTLTGGLKDRKITDLFVAIANSPGHWSLRGKTRRELQTKISIPFPRQYLRYGKRLPSENTAAPTSGLAAGWTGGQNNGKKAVWKKKGASISSKNFLEVEFNASKKHPEIEGAGVVKKT